MKRLLTALGICALLITASEAKPTHHTWSAANDETWHYYDVLGPPYDNWNNVEPGDYPARQGTDDTALINNCPSSTCPVFNSNSGTRTVDTITIDADTLGVEVSLTVSGGSLTTGGTVLVKGKQDAAGDDYAATMAVSGGTFAPNNLYLDGGPAVDNEAVLDFNESVTVQSSGTDDTFDTIAEGYTWIDIITSETFDAREMMVDASAGYAEIYQKTGTGTVQANELRISAGGTASWNAFYRLGAGALDVNGEVELNALSAVNATAEMQVDPSTTFTPDSFDLNGGTTENRVAVLDFNASVTVQTSTGTSVDGWVDFEIADGKTFDAKGMTLVDSDTDLAVAGEVSTDSTLRYDSLTTNSGKMTFTGPLTVECY